MEKFSVIFAIFISLLNIQIVYPYNNLEGSNQKADNRKPVYIPGKCPENEWYWPGEEITDWYCDCAPRFVYNPPTDKCFELYRQGPCEKNEYLVLPIQNIIAECVANRCKNDTMVYFNGKCHMLYKTDACDSKGEGVLNVSPISLELECMQASATELKIITAVPSRRLLCQRGSRKAASGQCRMIVG